MNDQEELSQNNILVKLPVNITYTAIEDYLRRTMAGEIIKTENEKGKVSRYAQILDIGLEQSQEEKFDLAIDLKFKTLTTVFKNKEGRILLHVAFFFDEAGQEVSVSDFKLKGITGNWLMDNTLEAMANSLLRGKLMKKMKFDLRPIIEEKISELNQKMEEPYELSTGINLFGKIGLFKINNVLPKPLNLLVLAEIKANAVIDIEQLDFDKPDPSENISNAEL